MTNILTPDELPRPTGMERLRQNIAKCLRNAELAPTPSRIDQVVDRLYNELHLHYYIPQNVSLMLAENLFKE